MIWKRSGHCADALDKPAFLQAQIDSELSPMPKTDISQPVFAANLNQNRDASSKMEKNRCLFWCMFAL
jgi:hypothetical protein